MSKDASEPMSDEAALAMIRGLAARGRIRIKSEVKVAVSAIIQEYVTLGPWIEKVLNAAGIGPQHINDRMLISDFIDHPTAVERCRSLGRELGVPVEPTDTVVAIARSLRAKEEGGLA